MANQLADLQHLIRQLGPHLPDISTITEEDLDSWQIIFNTGFSLHIRWQEIPERVLLYCAIGQPVEAQREKIFARLLYCLLYTSPSPRDRQKSRMPSSA